MLGILRKMLLLILIGILALIQTGCWDQKIYEDIGFILQIGLEKNQDNELLYTVSIPVISPDQKGKAEVISTTANLLRESRENIRRVEGRNVEGGKIQHFYASKDLARQGISKYFDIFIRNPENPLLANVVVVDGSPQEMMKNSSEFKDKPLPAVYVNDLLVEARRNSYVPETRIYDFMILEHSNTIDPTTPLLKYTSEAIIIAGTALFNGDKMVGEINAGETGMLHGLMGKKSSIQYYHYEQGNSPKHTKGAAILIKGTKRRVEISAGEKAPDIDIKLDMRASIAEYTGTKDLDKRDDLVKLEEEVAQSIKAECSKLLEYMQSINSDPIGFEEMIRSKHNEYWKGIEWANVYKDINFNVEVKVKFEFYGAIN